MMDVTRDERGAPVFIGGPGMNPERTEYLIALAEARAIVDDGGGIDYPVFQCADPRCAGREFGAAEFVAHREANEHHRLTEVNV